MNLFYTSSSLLTAIFSFALGTFVYLKAPKSSTNRAWFLMSLSVAIWSMGFGIMVSGAFEKNLTLCLERLSHLGAIFIATFYLYFIVSLIDKVKKYKNLIYISYFSAIILSLFVFSKMFIMDIVPKQIFTYYPKPGIIYLLFNAHFFIFVTLAGYLALKNFNDLSGFSKNQIRYVLVASIVGFLGGATTFPLVYDLNFPPIGGPFVFMYTLVISYAIVRYRLMDIKVAITRFGIFAFVYALVLGVPFWIGYKYYLWRHSTWLMAILATLGPFIYISLEKRSKGLLYKTEFKRYETLRKFSKTLLLIKELDKLLELIVYRLVKTLKVNYAGVYLYDKEKDGYILKSYRPLSYPFLLKDEVLTKNDPLVKLLFGWGRELIREEIANLPLDKKLNNGSRVDLISIQDKMRRISATLIIPHFIENDLLGFLVLGDKEKSSLYTEEDISILSSLSNSAALAIENALFLIDLRITQGELFNAKRVAELGYMASAMGHEINNRLQGIYTAAFDLTDNEAVKACLSSNPQLKAVFDKDIAHINENVEDASKIINELKTYARPQDKAKQTFEKVDLKDVLDKAIRVVKLQSAKAFDKIVLDIHIPQHLSNIQGNFIQLQQVFVNMLNNAYDAIIEKRNYVGQNPGSNIPADYNGSIQIKMGEAKNRINIHIIDDGIGMTEEIRKRVFIPLYTSKASSERKNERETRGGTGIGLYTIQTIVRGHDGSIDIHHTERFKGTDFLITLPVLREK